MKHIFILLATFLLMTTTSATAQTADRKLLSIEDVVLNRDLTPKSYPVRWVGESDSYAIVEGDEITAYDARTAKKRTSGCQTCGFARPFTSATSTPKRNFAIRNAS